MPAGTQRHRREERIDLLIRASMHADASGGAVRLCNISPIGALIEGEALPMVGDEVELRRGPLAVAGRIVWRGSDQAGVSFDERTIVEDWLPSAHPKRVVDRVFQRILQEQRRAEDDGATIAPLLRWRSWRTRCRKRTRS